MRQGTVRQSLSAASCLRSRQELALDDLLDGGCRQETLRPQGWLARVYPHEDHCWQALDLHARMSSSMAVPKMT